MTGKEIAATMRKHKVTIKVLAERLGTTMKRVREVRAAGLTDEGAIRDWLEAITNAPPVDPTTDPDAPRPRRLLLLPPSVATIVKLTASGEQQRFGATTGVRLLSTNRGYRIEATDGRRAAILTGPVAEAADFPALPAIAQAASGATEGVLPVAAWTAAFRSTPRGRAVRVKPILGNLAVVLAKDAATLASTDMERVSAAETRLVDGRFPDIRRAMPTGQPKAVFAVDAKLLAELLEVAASVVGKDALHRVTVEVRGENDVLVLRAIGEAGEEFTGLAVPLATNKAA